VPDVALAAAGIGKRFDGVIALDDVSLTVAAESIHGVIGPNGAGKTTLLNVVTGYLRPNQGRVVVHGVDVTSWSPSRRVPLGVVRTFQNIRLFGGVNVGQKLLVGDHQRAGCGLA
jgi:branched-chain amino acid transport system ATP-binding protein